MLYIARADSDLGPIAVATSERGAAAIELDGDEARLRRRLARAWRGVEVREDAAPNRGLIAEVRAYLDGRLRRFTVRPDLRGTEFQLLVWGALRRIPFGETRSYGEVARAVGRPRAARAIGAACNANPLPLLVPCHRVVGADGALVGFGGGLALKERLLALEGRDIPAHVR